MTTEATPTRYDGLRVAMNVAADFRIAGQLIPADVEAAYQTAAEALGIDLLITEDDASANDWQRGEDLDQVREAWQTLHDTAEITAHDITYWVREHAPVLAEQFDAAGTRDLDLIGSYLAEHGIDPSEAQRVAEHLPDWT